MSSPRPNEHATAPPTPTVLTFVPYYLPGYKSGGPVRSLANLVGRLGRDVRFIIVTADRDSGDRASYPDITPGMMQCVGDADVIYLDAAGSRARHMAALVRRLQPDVLYLNSFFSPRFSLALFALRHLRLIPWLPVIVAPRGEFSPGALQVKALKKRAFLALSRALRLHRDVVWQATTPLEADDIRRSFGEVERDGSSRIVVAPIIASADPAPPPTAPVRHKQPGLLRVAFLSRLTRKKNLLGALQILHGIRGNVELSIYGPIEDESYWRMCRQAIDALPGTVCAAYRGPVPASDVHAALADHHLFFLPTLGENYGHVIREALAAGTPVLISDQTPWRNLTAAQVGWDLPLHQPEVFRAVIETCIAMDADTWAGWSQRAAAYAWQHAADDGAVEANRRLFANVAVRRGTTPRGQDRARRRPLRDQPPPAYRRTAAPAHQSPRAD